MDFRDHPDSITEIRSAKQGAAAGRLPRDALIHVLKMIDQGRVNPDHLVVCYRDPLRKEDDGHMVTSTYYSVAGPDPHVVLGMMMRTIMELTGRK